MISIENFIKKSSFYDKDNQIISINNKNDFNNVYKIVFNGIRMLDEIPEFIYVFKNLEELNIKNNNIKEINNIEKSNALKILNLSGNFIESTKGLENCTNIENLDLSKNLIIDIEGIESNININNINLNDNKIENMDRLNNLINLEYINLSNNRIERIPVLDNFKKLKVLNLNKNLLKDFNDLKNLPKTKIFKEIKIEFNTNINKDDILKYGDFDLFQVLRNKRIRIGKYGTLHQYEIKDKLFPMIEEDKENKKLEKKRLKVESMLNQEKVKERKKIEKKENIILKIEESIQVKNRNESNEIYYELS